MTETAGIYINFFSVFFILNFRCNIHFCMVEDRSLFDVTHALVDEKIEFKLHLSSHNSSGALTCLSFTLILSQVLI